MGSLTVISDGDGCLRILKKVPFSYERKWIGRDNYEEGKKSDVTDGVCEKSEVKEVCILIILPLPI